MRRTTSSKDLVALLAMTALMVAMALASASVAGAASSQDSDTQGAALLGAVQNGSKKCANLSATDFAAIGEYTMTRMIGSTQSHEAMDRLMSTMMGAGAERRVHEAMGRRFAGCGTAGLPAGFGRMMGAVNAVGMMGGGMMGGIAQGGRFYGAPGSMMGGYFGARAGNDNNNGPSAAAMLGMMAVLIVAVALVLIWLRPRRRPAGPLELLQQRFARGELTADEYRDRKRLLEGA